MVLLDEPLYLHSDGAYALCLVPMDFGEDHIAVVETHRCDSLELAPVDAAITSPQPAPVTNTVPACDDLDSIDRPNDLERHALCLRDGL
jgi:hypothetical protein